MRNLTLKTTLSALLVSLPAAGAFAETNGFTRSPAEAAYTSSITSSVGAVNGVSYARLLDSRLKAAEVEIKATAEDGSVSPHKRAQVLSDLRAIRQAASQERQVNGGSLGEAPYHALSEQARAVQQGIWTARNGG